MAATEQTFFDFAAEVGKKGILPKDLTDYFGYGLFVGVK